MITVESIRNIIEPKLAEDGCFVVEVKISGANDISVVIDSVKGISIDYCIEISRLIEGNFNRDEEDYSLEVSSAGIGCELKVRGQYEKNIGNDVEITFANGSRKKGKLVKVNDEDFEVEIEEKVQVEGKKKKETVVNNYTYKYTEIKKVKDII